MADKTIGSLRKIPGIYGNVKIPAEFQGEAVYTDGEQWIEFARAAVKPFSDGAAQSAQEAVKSAASAEKSAGQAAQSAQEAKTAESSAENSKKSAALSADSARRDAASSSSGALLSRSWAIGGTGSREGENTNNSKYWANRAQAYAEQTNNPVVVQGVYNYILQDRITGDRYALLVENGTLELLGVPNTMDATDMALIDTVTGKKQQLIVENGTLKLLEVK